ncbi:hypothetical protein VCHA39O220_110083 [Vibrio chagasii]|nr:hypothetical protein VCHA39O220_110083 [Vibrio chagasii]CAH7142086.1 hypothetical protein VCHA39O224_100099 [Vibrio chagasii]
MDINTGNATSINTLTTTGQVRDLMYENQVNFDIQSFIKQLRAY